MKRFLGYGMAAVLLAAGCGKGKTPATDAEVLGRIPQLKKGMTEPQVWAFLGVENRGWKVPLAGSGAPGGWPATFLLAANQELMTLWDIRVSPPVLTKAWVIDNRDRTLASTNF